MSGLELRLDDDALDRLADLVAARLADRFRPEPYSPWLTPGEAAAYLRCSLSRIRKLTMLGALPVHRDGGKAFYRRDELDRFVEAGGASTGR